MDNVLFTSHARHMLDERAIAEAWVWRTLGEPDRADAGDDGNMHYMKAIPEFGGRFLHVVLNEQVLPNRVVTVFFDRRLGKSRL